MWYGSTDVSHLWKRIQKKDFTYSDCSIERFVYACESEIESKREEYLEIYSWYLLVSQFNSYVTLSFIVQKEKKTSAYFMTPAYCLIKISQMSKESAWVSIIIFHLHTHIRTHTYVHVYLRIFLFSVEWLDLWRLWNWRWTSLLWWQLLSILSSFLSRLETKSIHSSMVLPWLQLQDG